MTGLDLDSFLRLVQADQSTWIVVGLASLGLAFLVWSSWGSRRALRKCLILSLAAHLGLVLYGSTVPSALWALGPERQARSKQTHIRQIRVASLVDRTRPSDPRAAVRNRAQALAAAEQVKSDALRWDFVAAAAQPADVPLRTLRPKLGDTTPDVPDFSQQFSRPADVVAATPRVPQQATPPPAPEPRTSSSGEQGAIGPVPTVPMAPIVAEVDRPEPAGAADGEGGRGKQTAEPAGGGIVFRPDRRLRARRSETPIPNGSGTLAMNRPNLTRAGSRQRASRGIQGFPLRVRIKVGALPLRLRLRARPGMTGRFRWPARFPRRRPLAPVAWRRWAIVGAVCR